MPNNLMQRIEEAAVDGRRLGRHIDHDLRSVEYLVEAWEASRLRTKLWRRRAPILDQGEVGSCTGNALAGVLGTDWARGHGMTAVDEGFAVELYELATTLDRIPGRYPPDDTGSSGLAVCHAGRDMAYLASYRHAFSLYGAVTALQVGPVITGVNWYDSFDEPDGHGLVAISPDAQVRGGHEVEVLGVDVDDKTITCANSWGEGWGDGGYFQMCWDTWERLLHEHGDVTVPVRI